MNMELLPIVDFSDVKVEDIQFEWIIEEHERKYYKALPAMKFEDLIDYEPLKAQVEIIKRKLKEDNHFKIMVDKLKNRDYITTEYLKEQSTSILSYISQFPTYQKEIKGEGKKGFFYGFVSSKKHKEHIEDYVTMNNFNEFILNMIIDLLEEELNLR